LIGILTTEILLREDRANDIDLYYFGWTKEQAAKFPDWNLGYVHENMLNTKIEFSTQDEEKAFASTSKSVSRRRIRKLDNGRKKGHDQCTLFQKIQIGHYKTNRILAS